MNILILGCSFGVPNYFGPPGAAPEEHTESLLRAQGHWVYNCAINSGSNLETLDRARRSLLGETIQHPSRQDWPYPAMGQGQHIDWIVWFHTSVMRDVANYPGLVRLGHDRCRDLLARLAYDQCAVLQASLGARLALIGGAGALNHNFSQYLSADFVIHDWKEQILGVSVPPVQFMGRNVKEILSANADSLQYKETLVSQQLDVLNQLRHSELFPDGCHPGREPHHRLTQQLIQAFDVKP